MARNATASIGNLSISNGKDRRQTREKRKSHRLRRYISSVRPRESGTQGHSVWPLDSRLRENDAESRKRYCVLKLARPCELPLTTPARRRRRRGACPRRHWPPHDRASDGAPPADAA